MTTGQHTILIIDDCLEDREVYRRYLTKDIGFDYKIVTAGSGEEGLGVCRTWRMTTIRELKGHIDLKPLS